MTESTHGRSLQTTHSGDLKYILAAFAAGFVLLAGLIIQRTDALDDRIDALAVQVTEIETELREHAEDHDVQAGAPRGLFFQT